MATDNIARAIAAKALQIAQTSGGGEGRGLSKVEIDKDGFLILTFTDGTVSNVGKVVGEDGKMGQVYVPHIDEGTSVLSWTIEDKAGEIPNPIDLSDEGEWEDLNEEGEWGDIGGSGSSSESQTDYSWETL